MKAVVLAGGKGSRLKPYTMVLPKPLMPIGDMPILELVVRQLVGCGIEDIVITVGHLGSLIETFCGDGSQFGARITYAREDKPLGTIGPLAMIDDLGDRFLVMNGDLLTDFDYARLAAFHQGHGGILSVATTTRAVKINYGVISSPGVETAIATFTEKPTLDYQVSMGIYCMSRAILSHIPQGQAFGFDHLMHKLMAARIPVHQFRYEGKWFDIGIKDEYEAAESEFTRSRDLFIKATP